MSPKSRPKVTLTWSPIWKLTNMKLKKIISPSGQVYLNVYMFRNETHIGVDFISVILTDLELNTRYELLCGYFSTGLHMKTWELIMKFQRFLFITNTFQMLFEIGVFRSFAIFTGKPMCWSRFSIKLQGWRPAILLKRDSSKGVFLENIAKL